MLRAKERQAVMFYVLASLTLVIMGIVMGNVLLAALSILVLLFMPIVCKSFKRELAIVLVMYFVLDQISFQVVGGTFRLYFVFSVVIIYLLFAYWKSIFASDILRALLSWVVVCVVLSLVSTSPTGSLLSFFSTILQMLSAFAIFFILYSKTISLREMDEVFVKILAITFVFGIIQFIIYKSTGIALGINESVVAGQLASGQIPGFRHEGNALGKLLGWGIIFCIPPLVNLNNGKRKYNYILILLVVVFIMSITRTVLYGLTVTAVFAACWYIYRKKAGKVCKAILIFAILAMGLALLISLDVIQIQGYSLYKLQNMFLNIEETSQDGSARYRLASMKQGYDIWFSSIKNTWTGVGYSQARADMRYLGGVNNSEVGGCDLMNIGVSFGIIGLAMYLRVILKSFFNTLYATLSEQEEIYHRIWCERVIFALIYYVVLQALSGSMLVPEFWMTFGIGAYCSLRRKDASPQKSI